MVQIFPLRRHELANVIMRKDMTGAVKARTQLTLATVPYQLHLLEVNIPGKVRPQSLPLKPNYMIGKVSALGLGNKL